MNMSREFVTLTKRGVVVLALTLGASGVVVSAQEEAREDSKETFWATPVVMGTTNPPLARTGARSTTQINITRWTSDQEREALFAELVENGQEGLVKALRKQEETGFVRSSGQGSRSGFPSERLRYAREIRDGDKRRIILALDRPISFAEAARRPRWNDYDLTFITLDIDDEGKGEGQALVGVQLKLNMESKTLEVENFGSQPVRLMNVRKP
ncbi:MAG: hypothetical protein BMS9Abin37_3117 [Acidobacteriota bacterium]|nr:MAG: hypothetical protein BMS9Abin37_3117 [Acidobacteriota bacterium]